MADSAFGSFFSYLRVRGPHECVGIHRLSSKGTRNGRRRRARRRALQILASQRERDTGFSPCACLVFHTPRASRVGFHSLPLFGRSRQFFFGKATDTRESLELSISPTHVSTTLSKFKMEFQIVALSRQRRQDSRVRTRARPTLRGFGQGRRTTRFFPRAPKGSRENPHTPHSRTFGGSTLQANLSLARRRRSNRRRRERERETDAGLTRAAPSIGLSGS